VETLGAHPDGTWVRLVIKQGWNRQVRRMFDAVHHPVRRLVRTRIGSLELGDLPVGQARPLRQHELASLRRESGLDAKPTGR
jgi:23S rRNA pseudouridine2605 synthase